MKFCKGRSRRGGAVATFIFFFILLMVILALAQAVLKHLSDIPIKSLAIDQDQNDCGTGVLNTGDVKVKSAAISELSEPSFWALTLSDAKIAAQEFPKETVLGYLDKSQEMRNWVRTHMQDPPAWLDTGAGSVILAQIENLQVHATATHNPTQAAKLILDFWASVDGYRLAAIDYLTFGGITSLKTLFETGSLTAASCASFPAQLSQMYDLALNGNMSRADRAQLLGKALVITSVMLVLGGSEGFTAKFKGALDGVGLAGSWDRIKPYLGKIGTTVSTHAAYLTTTLLEKLAQRFPSSAPWELGFVSDRLEAMVEVLHEKGVPNDVIEQKISGLVKAVGDSSNPEDVARDADAISYDDGTGIRMKVGSQNRLFLYSDADTMQYLPAKFLEGKVPGFVEGQPAFLKVRYWEKAVTVYHYYEGGPIWLPTVPEELAKARDIYTITVSVLTRGEFVRSLPRLSLANSVGASWLGDSVEISQFTLEGNDLKILLSQQTDIQGLSDFVIEGTASDSLAFKSGITSLDFAIRDVFGQTKFMRIYHDGYSQPSLGIQTGSFFRTAFFLSWDGVRLSVVYSKSESDFSVSTVYLADPSTVFSLGMNIPYQLPSGVTGVTSAFMIDHVNMLRPLENAMKDSSSMQAHGRLGTEIAYKVGREKLGVTDLVINEINRIGPDLQTNDGKFVIQARMLTQTRNLETPEVQALIQEQLKDLLAQLSGDFQNGYGSGSGYAILTYVDNDGITKVIVLEVHSP